MTFVFVRKSSKKHDLIYNNTKIFETKLGGISVRKLNEYVENSYLEISLMSRSLPGVSLSLIL